MKNLFIKNSQKGLTIVELMMAIVISAILVLTIGTMLVYAFLAWRNNSDQVELQRDATFAMDMISRTIRPAVFITSPTPGVPSSTLTIGSESFSLSGLDLNYNDGVATTKLIPSRVTNLQFTNNGPVRSITIDMRLESDTGRESLRIDNATISYRN